MGFFAMVGSGLLGLILLVLGGMRVKNNKAWTISILTGLTTNLSEISTSCLLIKLAVGIDMA